MSRSKGNTTSLLEISDLSTRRSKMRRQDGPDQAMPGQFCQPHCLNSGPLSSPSTCTDRLPKSSHHQPLVTDHLPLLRTFIRSSRIEPSSCNDPLSLSSRSIILRPSCHQCCPGSVSWRISFGIGCFPLPLLVSAGLRGSRWCSTRGGLGRRTVGGRASPLSGVLRAASENLTLLAGRLEIMSPSAGLLGGARGVCL